jgi:hypothetical protein
VATRASKATIEFHQALIDYAEMQPLDESASVILTMMPCACGAVIAPAQKETRKMANPRRGRKRFD